MRRSIFPAVIAVLAIAVGGGLWLGACEERVETLEVGWQGEAARNPYLASQRLLEAMGTEVRALSAVGELDELPPTDGTLLLPLNRNRTWSEQRSRELLDWARAGGHVIVVTWSLWDVPGRAADYILDPLGVQQFMHDEPEEEEEAAEDEAEPEVDVDEPPVLARLRFPGREAPLEVAFDLSFYLELTNPSSERFAMRDEGGAHLLTVSVGEGYVTALTDDYFLRSFYIDQYDHAELVYRLNHLFGREGPVWMLWEGEFPAWWQLLWRHAWMVCLALAVLLAFWIWRRALRFGPLRPDDPVDRRRLMEHVEAVGRFQFRRGGDGELAAAVRDSIQTCLRQRHPTWLTLDPGPLSERLAELTDLPAERIRNALAPGGGHDHERFARRIATLERIRRAL